MDTAIDTRAIRIAEIKADLANRKAVFFEHGIESPMHERATLEAELSRLAFESVKVKSAENARKMQVRQLRGELLRKRLDALGLAHIVDECNAEAEAAIPEVALSLPAKVEQPAQLKGVAA